MSSLFSGPSTPAPRNFTNEMMQTLAGYKATAPGYLNLEKTFQPQYQELALQQGYNQLFGTENVPGTLATGASADTFRRGADISDVQKYGPAATAAFLAANPGLAASLNAVQGGLTPSGLQTDISGTAKTGLDAGPTGLLKQLSDSASAQLSQGGELSPEEKQQADQQVREIYAAQGMTHGTQDLASEILNRDALKRQRLAAAQQFGTGVQGLLSQDQGQRQQFALGALADELQQKDYTGRAAQIFSTTLSDPFQAVLGRTSGAGGGSRGGGYPQQIGTGASMFDPTNPYAQDLYNTNYNASAAANIAQSNQQAALEAAGISSTAAIAAAVLPMIFAPAAASDKRLKTDIRKVGETPSGIPIKEFSFKANRKRKFIGAIAQDVEKIMPHAVHRHPVTGYKMLDYSATDAPFYEVPHLYRKAA